MKHIVTLIALLLGLMLIWQWFSHCGDQDIKIGETLPFCNDCSSIVSAIRLMFLVGAIALIAQKAKRLGQRPTIIHKNAPYPVHSILIHWHRIALLLAVLSFPLWITWLDYYTDIPGPDEIWITAGACTNPQVKGTFLWFFELVFVVLGFFLLRRKSRLDN